MLHGFNRDQPFFRPIALAAKEVGGDNVVDKVTLLENYWRGGKGSLIDNWAESRVRLN